MPEKINYFPPDGKLFGLFSTFGDSLGLSADPNFCRPKVQDPWTLQNPQIEILTDLRTQVLHNPQANFELNKFISPDNSY